MGRLSKKPAYAPTNLSNIQLGGVRLVLPSRRYLMLYKPGGVVCSHRGEGHRTVFELLREPHSERLHIAGRLDLEVTGLVLLTDDGAWSHALTSPRRKQGKTYRVTLAEGLPPSAWRRLVSGVLMRGEARPTMLSKVEIESQAVERLTVQEGRYHQVKRMVVAVGGHVIELHREAIGALALDPTLAPGSYRPLLEQEVEIAHAERGSS